MEGFAGSRVGDKHYEEWFAKLERLSVSPGAAVALARQVLRQIDVRDILPAIRVPTLVLHRRDDRAVPIAEGRYVAEHVPGAKFVELPGADHWPWIGDQGVVEEIQEFLTGIRESAEPERMLATVMFVDVVDSTNVLPCSGTGSGRTSLRPSTRSCDASWAYTEGERLTRRETGSS